MNWAIEKEGVTFLKIQKDTISLFNPAKHEQKLSLEGAVNSENFLILYPAQSNFSCIMYHRNWVFCKTCQGQSFAPSRMVFICIRLVITLFHYCLIFLSLLRLLALISVLSYLGSSVCLDCPPRYQCIRRVQADPCPQGSYCPGKTGYNSFPCPNGTFGARQFLLSSSECTQCTSGSYCGETGLDKVSGPCKPGMKYLIQLFWLILLMPAAWRIRKSFTFVKLVRNLSHTLECLFFLSLCKF